MVQVVREFTHKRFGSIGKVALDAAVTEVKLNGKVIPATSVEYLLTFALQSLQDAYAGSETEAEAQASFASKLDKLIAGTMGQRNASAGVDEGVKVARQIVRAVLKTQLGATSDDWKAFQSGTDAEQNERLDGILLKNEAKLRPLIDERLAEIDAERKRKAKLAKATAIDL